MCKMIKYAGIILVCWFILVTTGISGQLQEKYVGCFVESSNNQQLEPVLGNQNNLTIEICIQKCYNENNKTKSEMTFATLTNGRSCMCRNNLGQQLRDQNCNVKCSGNRLQNCGGNKTAKFYSLYTVCPVGYFGPFCNQLCHCKRHLPCDRKTGICLNGCDDHWTGSSCNISNIQKQYIGCYGDGPNASKSMDVANPGGKTGASKSDINSIEVCIEVCSTYNYTFAGMHYGYDCLCGENYNRHGNKTYHGSQVNCNTHPCPANKSQMCGGSYANSVYYVCPVGFYGRDCVNRCHCNGHPCRFNGSCLCKPGWTGSACNTRDCRNNSGDCESDEMCEDVDLGFASLSMCRCKDGDRFYRDSYTCRPNVDECQLAISICNLTSEICVNNIGSYRCECKDGFVNISGKCEDIDECRNDSLVCDIETELCNNTIGSYTCQCKTGYENTTFGNCTDVDECQLGRSSSSCNANSEYCTNVIGSYICDCKEGFTHVSGKCEEFKSTPTLGITTIILGALLTISFLINALFVVSRIKNANSRNPEPGKEMTQSGFQPRSIELSDQPEMKYDEIPELVGQNNVYEQFIPEHRRIIQNPNSEYAELKLDDCVDVESSIC